MVQKEYIKDVAEKTWRHFFGDAFAVPYPTYKAMVGKHKKPVPSKAGFPGSAY